MSKEQFEEAMSKAFEPFESSMREIRATAGNFNVGGHVVIMRGMKGGLERLNEKARPIKKRLQELKDVQEKMNCGLTKISNLHRDAKMYKEMTHRKK